METSRQTSLENCPDQDCPKCGPMGAEKEPKLALKSLLTTQIGHWAYFRLEGGNEVGIPMKTSRQISLGLLPHKLVQGAYFGLEGGNEVGIPMKTFRPIIMSQIWPYWDQKGAKKSQNSILGVKNGPNWSVWIVPPLPTHKKCLMLCKNVRCDFCN